MNFNDIELRRETLFKDAVLSAAETKSMEIIAEAQKKSAEELAKTKLLCKEADHDAVAAKMMRQTQREHNAMLLEARNDLIRLRSKLVDEVFAEVENRLASFAASGEYKDFLCKCAELHKEIASDEKAKVTIFLREEDETYAGALQKILPGSTVSADSSIRLGGLRMGNGRTLFDETLDARLAAEKERFYRESKLMV